MRIPIASQNKPRKAVDDIIRFLGYNDTDQYQNGELKYMENMSSDSFPNISTRKARKNIKKLNDPKYLFSSEKLCWIDGSKFYWDGVEKGTLSKAPISLIDFNGHIIIFPDKKYYDYVEDKWGSFEGPDIDYATVSNNRVFGVKGSEFYASRLGDFKTWDSFQGLSTDSYAADVATAGNFNGITNYSNHVTMFKKNFIHELYGDKPSNYMVPEAFKSGLVDNRSIQELGARLYFVGEEGVKIYSGGQPRVISSGLNKAYIEAVSGIDNSKYYLSLYDGSNHDLFVYDSEKRLWHREDDLKVIQFVNHEGDLLALTEEGDIIKFNTSEDQSEISWAIETQKFTDHVPEKKEYKNIYLMLEGDLGSFFTVYLKYDESDYENLKTIHITDKKSFRIPIKIKRCNSFQLKIEGMGNVKINQITREFFVGGDV